MKEILLIVLVLIVGCAKELEPINLEALNERDDVYYTKDTNKPYTGAVFGLYESGEKLGEGYLKDGNPNGKWTEYYENGQIKKEQNYKDGKKDGKGATYNEDGSIDRVEKWKDGEKVY